MRPSSHAVTVGGQGYTLPLTWAALLAFTEAGLAPDEVATALALALRPEDKVRAMTTVKAVNILVLGWTASGGKPGSPWTPPELLKLATPRELRETAEALVYAMVSSIGPEVPDAAPKEQPAPEAKPGQ